jgi:SAM-dependent methyltransferase
LDAGAGEQPFKEFCTHLRYVSQDFGRYSPENFTTGLHPSYWDYGDLDIVSDICSIPEPDGSFDAILCTEVLEHISDPAKVIHEFARLLRPGGTLILTAPFSSLTHFAPYYYYTGYSRYFFEERLREAGFQIIELRPNGNYFEYLGQELRRLPEIASRYSYRQARFWHRVISYMLLSFLEKCSRSDRGSSEIMAFGWLVMAAKK